MRKFILIIPVLLCLVSSGQTPLGKLILKRPAVPGGLPAVRDNLIVDEGFENPDPWPTDEFVLGQDNLGEFQTGVQNTWARVQSFSDPNEGFSNHQIEVRPGCDGCQSQGYRSEMTFVDNVSANNTIYWYGVSMKFISPASGGFWTGNNSGCFLQWHPTSSSGIATVALSNDYNENGNGWTLWSPDNVKTESGTDITSNVWHHVVLKIFWGTGSNGYIKGWIDGTLEWDVTGIDFDGGGQYMKFGMNRWSWSGPTCAAYGCTSSSYPTTTWIIAYDNLRIGNSSATYNDVAPIQVLPELSIKFPDLFPKPSLSISKNIVYPCGSIECRKPFCEQEKMILARRKRRITEQPYLC